MAACLTWIHVGDLHVDGADGYEGLSRLRTLVAVAPVRGRAGGDRIEILVCNAGPRARRNPPAALGRDVNAIGAWPERVIEGAQRDPNKNELDW